MNHLLIQSIKAVVSTAVFRWLLEDNTKRKSKKFQYPSEKNLFKPASTGLLVLPGHPAWTILS